MPVFVDSPLYHLGRMHMCHMLADTTEELLAMADVIGVDRRHLQNAGMPTEHFDVCKSKRTIAVGHGALEVSGREIARIIRAKRELALAHSAGRL